MQKQSSQSPAVQCNWQYGRGSSTLPQAGYRWPGAAELHHTLFDVLSAAPPSGTRVTTPPTSCHHQARPPLPVQLAGDHTRQGSPVRACQIPSHAQLPSHTTRQHTHICDAPPCCRWLRCTLLAAAACSCRPAPGLHTTAPAAAWSARQSNPAVCLVKHTSCSLRPPAKCYALACQRCSGCPAPATPWLGCAPPGDASCTAACTRCLLGAAPHRHCHRPTASSTPLLPSYGATHTTHHHPG